jgi:hypothetical protein
MSNDWKDYPRHFRSNRKPLFDTGNREGYEEIKDGAKFVAGKVASGFKKLFGRKKKDEPSV